MNGWWIMPALIASLALMGGTYALWGVNGIILLWGFTGAFALGVWIVAGDSE